MARAIIAGRGDLPRELFGAARDAIWVSVEGVNDDPPDGATVIPAAFEKLGRLFSDLKSAGVDDIVMAGAMDRPRLNPARFDLKMMRLAPRLLKALKAGDDGLLGEVIAIFEGEGFRVVGPDEIAPGLVARADDLQRPETRESTAMKADAARARDVLRALGGLDVGQAAVVAQGQVLGIETVQGTDALLEFVAATPAARRGQGGVLVKWPKPGQDLRVDMPTIGPHTVDLAIAAGLQGICLADGGVLILQGAAVRDKARVGNIHIWAEPGTV